MRFFKRSLIVAILFLASFAQASEAERPTYKLNLENDFPVTLAAGGMFGIGMFLYSRMDTPDNPKDKGNLLPWDKPLAGRYSENADRASDIGSVFAIAPLVVGGIAWHDGSSTGGEFATFTVMFLQAIGIGNGINLAIRSLEIWPRPYMYAESGDGREKAENAKSEAYGSFFSGHATAAFTVATFTDQWFRTAYPNSPYKGIMRASAYSLATLESVLRVAAGKHYFTDVLVGALVGTGVSIGILEMHKDRNENFSVWVGPGVAGITLRI
jgi:membrane-associated phospholipid phosphatase